MNISEIAELAGVSRATVSRYFNNGYVSAEKRDKIKAVIEKTGYLPSASARSLRTKRSGIVGVIVPKISSESISKIVHGISTTVGEKGYHIMLGNTDNSTDKELEYLNIFKNNGVDGVVFIATIFTKKHMQELKELPFPVVIVGQELDGYCCIYHSDYEAAKEMTYLLCKDGCRQPAYLGVTEKDKAVGQERKRGFQQAIEECGVTIEPQNVVCGEFDMDSGYSKMKELLAQSPDIDAVFCATDTIAFGAVEAIKEAGKRIPEDIAVTGMGGGRMSGMISPKLSTVRYFYEESGTEAGKIMIDFLEMEETHTRKLKLGYEVIKRESTR